MSFAAVMPAAACCAVAEDRSLSEEATSLRESLAAAASPPARDRGDEIYRRVADALEKARQRDGILIIPETFGRALEVLDTLPAEIPLPDVVVESENEIGLDWDEGARLVLSLTVRDTPAVGFAGLFGVEPVHGRVVFAEDIPQTLRFFFRKLYPSGA